MAARTRPGNTTRVLELAVLSGDGKCVTRGRVETIDDDDDDDDDAGGSGTGKRRGRMPRRARRAAEKQRRSPCCFGAAAREPWTVPDADVDAWLARHEPRAHERGAAEDANALFAAAADGADVALVMARRAAWVRFPAGGGRGRQTGAEKAADAARRADPSPRGTSKPAGPSLPGTRSAALFSLRESSAVAGDESAESDARSARRARNAFPATRPRRRGDALVHARGRGARPPRAQPLVAVRAGTSRRALRGARRRRAGALRDSERRGPESARRLARRQRARGVGRRRARVRAAPRRAASSWTRRGTSTRPPWIRWRRPRTVAYVPPRDKCPLALESRLESDDAAGTAAAFDASRRGGVVVWNPATCAGGLLGDK